MRRCSALRPVLSILMGIIVVTLLGPALVAQERDTRKHRDRPAVGDPSDSPRGDRNRSRRDRLREHLEDLDPADRQRLREALRRLSPEERRALVAKKLRAREERLSERPDEERDAIHRRLHRVRQWMRGLPPHERDRLMALRPEERLAALKNRARQVRRHYRDTLDPAERAAFDALSPEAQDRAVIRHTKRVHRREMRQRFLKSLSGPERADFEALDRRGQREAMERFMRVQRFVRRMSEAKREEFLALPTDVQDRKIAEHRERRTRRFEEDQRRRRAHRFLRRLRPDEVQALIEWTPDEPFPIGADRIPEPFRQRLEKADPDERRELLRRFLHPPRDGRRPPPEGHGPPRKRGPRGPRR